MINAMYCYNNGSKGGKALAQALGIKRLKHEGSRFKARPDKTLLNWGSSQLPENLRLCRILNAPEAVSKASNKLSAFEAMAQAGVSVPRFTTDPVEALEWGKDVVVRHKLNGNSGEGIEILEAGRNPPEAPLYVEYVKKINEFRVHVVDGKAIRVQRKARKLDVPDDQVNWKVRNLAGGFIFAVEGVDLTEGGLVECVKAVKALGLDFGAVDLIYNNVEKKFYVLEVNTAPGLEGSTLEDYTLAFKNFV